MTKHPIRIIVYLYLLGVVVLAFVPFGGVNVKLESVDVLSLRLDYLVHALVFIPLVPLWWLVWPHHRLWQVLLLGMVIAASAEVVQYIVPYRSFNINDMVANVLGVGAGALFVMAKEKTLKAF